MFGGFFLQLIAAAKCALHTF